MVLDIKKEQSLLLKFIFKQIKPVNEFSLKDYSFSSNSNDFYTSAMACIGDNINLCVSLPKNSNQSFICVTDADDSEIGKVVASLQSYHETKSSLSFGHTVPLITNEYVTNHHWYAALLLSVDTLFDGFENSIEQEGLNYDVQLVCFITNDEHTKKVNEGLDALLDEFEACDRDIVSFF